MKRCWRRPRAICPSWGSCCSVAEVLDGRFNLPPTQSKLNTCLGILNITFKYLLKIILIISPIFGWCLMRTSTHPCLRPKKVNNGGFEVNICTYIYIYILYYYIILYFILLYYIIFYYIIYIAQHLAKKTKDVGESVTQGPSNGHILMWGSALCPDKWMHLRHIHFVYWGHPI